MNRRFKFSVIFLILTFVSEFVFSENKNLSALMKDSYKAGFYPGVVRYAEEILCHEKDSLSAFRAAVYEGESLFKMGRTEDSIAILQKYQMKGESINPETIQLNSAKFYWLGRGYFVQRQFSSAQKCFFSSAAIFRELEKASSKTAESSLDYFALSMLHGGKSYIELKDYKNAIPLYEYVISNGGKYFIEDYKDSAIALAQSYNFTADSKNAQKCVKLVASLENAKFDDETKFSLLILKGEAYEILGSYKAAYDEYCRVIKNAPAALAASAMQKAYAVSTVHRDQVGSEAGEVLSRAEYRLAEYPDLLSEFWTRLAVDAFNAKNYKKSLEYFKDAQKNASSSQKEIAAVYRAEIAYITNEDKNAGAKAAVAILAEAVLSKSASKNETILLSIARFNGYIKNWKDCEIYASKCLKSSNPEIEKNAVYWLALAKYETGEVAKASAVIENYKKDNKIEDKSLLNLYAKALAKQGKYHDADLIFYSLGQKNQLDNDGRLDYSRTLLIAGHYVSTKQQASKAKGDEAVYLSALASFNQHNWREAQASFAKVLSSKTLDKDYVAYAQFYHGYALYQLGEYEKSVSSLNHFIEENPTHTFIWSAYMTVARAAAFSKDEGQAVSASQKAIKTAKNEKDKQESIILAAGILSDGKKFDEALSLLSPHISKKTEFGWECKYRSAEILVQKGSAAQADRYFEELASLTEKEANLIAEESAYRRAEIAYSAGDYSNSARLFEFYSKNWADGRFAYAAIYFSADSLAKSGNDVKAILRYQQITDSKAETSYRYGSEKNLIELYQKTGDYVSALEMANRMIDEYGSQALNDGIGKKVSELKKLGAGSAVSIEDKVKLAEKSLAKTRNDPSKSEESMKNAIFLADAYRLKGENKKSAETYLEAAKFSRQAGNDENAARSFYGAVESFDAAGLYADEKATFKEMKKLYPQNKYTLDAEKIAGGL